MHTSLFSLIILGIMLIFNQHYAYKIYHPKSPKLAQFHSRRRHIDASYGSVDGQGYVNVTENELYMVGLKLGGSSPLLSEEVILLFDTGSEFVWVQSANCTVCMDEGEGKGEGSRPSYNGSSTLLYHACNLIDPHCNSEIPGSTCGADSRCHYHAVYGDGTESRGIVVSDIVFPYADKGNNMANTFLTFGIGLNNTCLPFSNDCFQGIAGFGVGALSLPSQLSAKRWGFCLPANTTIDGAFLVGNSVMIPGAYSVAPITHDDGAVYYIELTNVFLRGDGTLNKTYDIFVDSGTAITRFEAEIMNILLPTVSHYIFETYGGISIRDPTYPFSLCYAQQYNIEITIQMAQILVTISDNNLVWTEAEYDEYCLNFIMSDSNILGSQCIAGYMVVYDLVHPKNRRMEISKEPLSGKDAQVCFSPATP